MLTSPPFSTRFVLLSLFRPATIAMDPQTEQQHFALISLQIVSLSNYARSPFSRNPLLSGSRNLLFRLAVRVVCGSTPGSLFHSLSRAVAESFSDPPFWPPPLIFFGSCL